MTAVVYPASTEDERRESLRRIAEGDDWDIVTRITVGCLAHISFVNDMDTLDEAWAEFRARHLTYLKLRDGFVTWREVYPGWVSGCPDPFWQPENAIELALQEADERLDVLIRGTS